MCNVSLSLAGIPNSSIDFTYKSTHEFIPRSMNLLLSQTMKFTSMFLLNAKLYILKLFNG